MCLLRFCLLAAAFVISCSTLSPTRLAALWGGEAGEWGERDASGKRRTEGEKREREREGEREIKENSFHFH